MNAGPVARWQALSQLYEQADELDGVALQDHLQSLEQRAEPLLPDLRQMLQARNDAVAHDFLAALPVLRSPALEHTPAHHAGAAGLLLGPYRLLRPIGEGGMAEVWLAERADGAFRRQVAVKLLHRPGGARHRDVFAQRFSRERDILAALDHPHIAALHDAGLTPEGQAWLALDYVEGQPITAWCDAKHLELQARMRLFLQVLDAVAHAHANLVLHRDLKPSNILVDTQGQARLLDFGIAKLLEADGASLVDTELTRHGGRPLTLSYASPEQLQGRALTTASDVYSLGVLLYELLCGQRPAEPRGDSVLALERAVIEQDTRAPSRRVDAAAAAARGTSATLLRRQLTGDLDAIAGQALAKAPAARYATVQALRADLECWLAGEPVRARAPTLAYRTLRFVQRHRLGTALGAGAACALAAVAVVAVVQGLQARDEAQRAQAARAFVLDLFQRADPFQRHGAEMTAKEILTAGAARLATTLQDQPALRAELLGEIARAHRQMGLYGEATQLLQQRIELTRELGSEAHALAWVDAADHARRTGDLVTARASLVTAARALAGRRPQPTLAFRRAYVDGWVAIREERADAALLALRTALELAQTHFERTDVRRLDAMGGLAEALRLARRPEEALRLMQEAVDLARNTPELHAIERLSLHHDLIDTHYRRGDYVRVHADMPALLADSEAQLGPNSEMTLRMRHLLVVVSLRLGYVAESAAHVLALEKAALRVNSPERQAETLSVVQRWLTAAGRLDDRPDVARRLDSWIDGTAPEPLPPATRRGMALNRAESLLQSHHLPEARRLADALVAASPAQDDFASAWACLHLGLAAGSLGDTVQAERWLQRSEESVARLLGQQHPFTALARLQRAVALARLERDHEARALVSLAWPPLDAAYASSPQWHRLDDLRRRALGSAPVESPNVRHIAALPFVI
jgi:serine/threonine protein kinase